MSPTRSFAMRLWLGLVASLLLVAGLSAVLLGDQLQRNSREEIDQRLSAAAHLLGPLALLQVQQRGPEIDPGFQARVERLGREAALRLTVVAPDGRVLADSHRDPQQMDNRAARPELVAAREGGGPAWAERYSDTLGQTMRYVALGVPEEGELLALVRASLSTAGIEGRLAQLWRTVLLVALAATLLAAFVAWWLAGWLARPLRELTSVAGAIAAGDLERRAQVRSNDEVGRLAASFNRMAQRLGEQLRQARDDRSAHRAILDTMSEGVLALDGERRLLHANRAAREMFGLGEDAMGRPLSEVLRRSELDEAAHRAIATGEAQESELRIAGRQQDRVMELVAARLAAQGGGRGALLVLHDVSRLRQLEEMRRDFVTNVSHELKTPLAAIRGMVESVVDHEDMPAEVRGRFLGRVLDQVHRLSNLVGDLLELSAAERPGASLERLPIDLRATLQDCIEDHMAPAAQKDLLLESILPSAPARILGDREGLRQIFDNLLANAIRYTPAGGRVSVRLARRGDEFLVEVADSGIGIDPAEQARIFERFYRVDKARSRDEGGTGLGLSIAKHQVRRLEGRIELESRPGMGSEFRVFFAPAPEAMLRT